MKAKKKLKKTFKDCWIERLVDVFIVYIMFGNEVLEIGIGPSKKSAWNNAVKNILKSIIFKNEGGV